MSSVAATAELEGIRAVLQQSKDDFAKLQELYQQQKKTSENLQQLVFQLSSERDQVKLEKQLLQQEHADAHQKWRAEVKQLEDEVRRQAEKEIPADQLARLKAEYFREFDTKQREKIEAILQEKEALREALSRERKEHELLAGRVQQQELFHSRQMHEEAERHGQQLDELQQRILQLQELADDSSLNEELRAALNKVGELEVRVKLVRDELEEVRQSKEAVMVEREEMELRYIKGAKELQTQIAVAEQNTQAHVRRWKEISEELSASQAQYAQLHERLVAAERDKTDLLQRIDEKNRELCALEERDLKTMDDIRKSAEADKQTLQATIHSLSGRVAELQGALSEAGEAARQAEAQHQQQLATQAAAHARALAAAEETRAVEQQAAREAQRVAAQNEAAHHDEMQQMQREVEAARTSMRAATEEGGRARDRMEGLEQTLATLRRQHDARAQELDECQRELQQLQKRTRHLAEREHQLSSENESLRTKLEFAQHEVEVQQQESEQWQDQQAHILQRLKDIHARELQEAREEMERLHKSGVQAKHEDDQALAKLKEDKNKYKKMCVKLGQQVAQLQRDGIQQKKELTIALNTKQIEAQSLAKQLQEAERQRDELRLRLALDAGAAPLSFDSSATSSLGARPSASSSSSSSSAPLQLPLGSSSSSAMLQTIQAQQHELSALMAQLQVGNS